MNTILKALRIAVEERMEDADTALGIRGIGTDGVLADHQYGGMVYPVTDKTKGRKTHRKPVPVRNREDWDARKEACASRSLILLLGVQSSQTQRKTRTGIEWFYACGESVSLEGKDIVLNGRNSGI